MPDARRRVDLRSDTVTQPTQAMRRAMAQAEVGDDVYREDPTVRRLEELAAASVGTQDALFVPSGVMGNQIAIHLHSEPGADVLLDDQSHVYVWEMGGMAAWSGAFPRLIRTRDGRMDPAEVRRAVAPEVDYLSATRLLIVENSHNQAGGTVLPQEQKEALLSVARDHDLRTHLDGARIFNAAHALETTADRVAAGFDTVMFCLSKGLGAPVGSMLCGSREGMEQAREVRRRMGGAMRQVGVLAAAGIHALEQHVERLVEDHRRAQRLASGLCEVEPFILDPDTVQTNMATVELRRGEEQDAILDRLESLGVLALSMGPGKIRFTTHLDVDDADIEHTLSALRRL